MKPEPPVTATEIVMHGGVTIVQQIKLCYECLREVNTTNVGNFLVHTCGNAKCKQFAMPFAEWPQKEAPH